jgi:hypothetical protein
MPDASDIKWFKEQFHTAIEAAVQDTPFTLDLITAVACQETGTVWQVLRKKNLDVSRILELCVGDTLDADKGRRAFPKTKDELVAKPRGQEMFDLAHQALVDMAQFITSFQGVAARPNKFCHAFGIFQLDLQFFLTDPDYFLEKRYANFDVCLEKCIGELTNAFKRVPGLAGKTELSDLEMCFVAIAYNTGRCKPELGLKQGFRPAGGKFYGEQIFDFLTLSKTVKVDNTGASTGAPAPGD